MRHYHYWQAKGEEEIARIDRHYHIEMYFGAIQDIWLLYMPLAFYVAMTLISPKKRDQCKYDRSEEVAS